MGQVPPEQAGLLALLVGYGRRRVGGVAGAAGFIGPAEAEELFGAADFDPPNLKFFPQSVASGDPASEGIVL